ncbi:hypothetical protein PG993_002387 [Apiospora rasikravindrae]|uniref:Uncharacterized protein n=1 Tax=Apiospora rasikravindrae TaxID=990691 RepID=A0ABR1TWL2_9PEZI
MKQVPRVPRMQTGPEPLFQISAETEEAKIEQETVDATDEQTEEPYITNLLTPLEAEEPRAGAMSVLSLGQTAARSIFHAEASMQSSPSGGSGLPDVRDDGGESMQASTNAADSSTLAQELDTAEPQYNTSNASANSEQIERLLQEAKLPLVLQLIILWLMSLGTRRPKLENRGLLSSAVAAD